MLKLNGANFTVGRSRFVDTLPEFGEPTSKVYVKIVIPALDQPILAQLDTGAPWTVFEPEIAGAMDILGAEGDPIRLSTRFGILSGNLERVLVTILADEGESLDVEATVFVCSEWQGRNFLGYSGLLERIRFALDPREKFFYFGPTPD